MLPRLWRARGREYRRDSLKELRKIRLIQRRFDRARWLNDQSGVQHLVEKLSEFLHGLHPVAGHLGVESSTATWYTVTTMRYSEPAHNRIGDGSTFEGVSCGGILLHESIVANVKVAGARLQCGGSCT